MSMVGKKTVVIGASPNPERFSFKAVRKLQQYHHLVIAVGIRDGSIDDIQIQKGFPAVQDTHTVTLYIGPPRQPDYYSYILSLKPRRIIFNPGTYNDELTDLAEKNGINVMEACTLVLLATGNY